MDVHADTLIEQSTAHYSTPPARYDHVGSKESQCSKECIRVCVPRSKQLNAVRPCHICQRFIEPMCAEPSIVLLALWVTFIRRGYHADYCMAISLHGPEDLTSPQPITQKRYSHLHAIPYHE